MNRFGPIGEWGSTPAERVSEFGCDLIVPDPDQVLYRAVDVKAPPAHTFRWLCQLRAAPYSYDLLDNRGRRSPQELTAGLDQLETGQRFMQIFKLVAFEPGRSITLLTEGNLFGRIGCTYRADPGADDRSRIVVKLAVRSVPGRLRGPLMRIVLPPGDLVMMRRQLLNLATLAERSAPTRSSRSDRRS